MNTCKYCGAPITFVTKNGTRYALEGRGARTCFRPYVGDTPFLNMSGYVMTGEEVRDAQYGFKIHDCRGEFA